eukprot:m51a1_g5212 hypothetical protein (338) ;mRNA; f:249058-250433
MRALCALPALLGLLAAAARAVDCGALATCESCGNAPRECVWCFPNCVAHANSTCGNIKAPCCESACASVTGDKPGVQCGWCDDAGAYGHCRYGLKDGPMDTRSVCAAQRWHVGAASCNASGGGGGGGDSGKSVEIALISTTAAIAGLVLVAVAVVVAMQVQRLRVQREAQRAIEQHFREHRGGAEVCRACWGQVASVRCDDCGKLFCVRCSSAVHDDPRESEGLRLWCACLPCTKPLREHSLVVLDVPQSVDAAQQPQPQAPAQQAAAEAQRHERSAPGESTPLLAAGVSEPKAVVAVSPQRVARPRVTSSYTTMNQLMGVPERGESPPTNPRHPFR